MLNNILSEDAVNKLLKNKIIGKHFTLLNSVGSTNDYLKNLNCENGTVVAARQQIKGKGRLGRTWLCNQDEGLTFSLLLKPKITPSEVSAVTPLTGLAVCKALRNFIGINCKIKWPNDIIVGRKKLAGILTEMNTDNNTVNFIVIGIGVNVSQTSFCDKISDKATSVFMETGKDINKNEILCCILEQIEKTFIENNLELTHSALNEYSDLCATLGRNISFLHNGKIIKGIAVGIAENGELKVMLTDGNVCSINSGEVTVQGIY